MVDWTWFYSAKPLTCTTVASISVILTIMHEQNVTKKEGQKQHGPHQKLGMILGATEGGVAYINIWFVIFWQVHPAFWKPVKPTSGTQHDCNYGRLCPAHHGYRSTYDYPFHKKITIGTHGINNCFEFVSNFTIGGNWPQDDLFIQMESPAVYLTYEFSEQFTFNPTTRLAENYHARHLPVIRSTPDHNHALGAYTPPGQDTDKHENYNSRFFKGSHFAGTTSKFNIVFYKRPHGTGVRQYVYKTYFCVGTLNDVTSCLHKIMTAVPK